jgi:hypothetical protein
LAGLLTALAALFAALLTALATLFATLLTLLAGLIVLFAALLALLAGLALLATLVLLRHSFLLLVGKKTTSASMPAFPRSHGSGPVFFHVIRYVSHPRKGLTRSRTMTARPAAKSNLNDLLPPWEREFPHPMHDPILRGLFGIDMNVLRPPIGEQPVRDASTLAQDVFRACVIRQRGI